MTPSQTHPKTKLATRLAGLAPALTVVAAVALGCVTINVYFPEAEIKDLSEKIEDEIERRAEDEGADDQSAALGRAPGWSLRLWAAVARPLLDLSAGEAQAQGERVADPGVTNPAIRAVIDSRAARLGELRRLKSAGVVGETNTALVEIRNLDALSDLRERAGAQRLVKAENQDREAMFKEMASATGVDLSQVPRIRTTYASTLRNNARPGDWIQMPDGTWKQK